MAPADLISDVLDLATSLSVESRQIVQCELADLPFEPRHADWLDLIRERSADRDRERRLTAAAKLIPRFATPTLRPFVKRAVARLLTAVRDLASWAPAYRETECVVSAPVARWLFGMPEAYT